MATPNDRVFILMTRGTREGSPKEYRVIRAESIEGITLSPDYPNPAGNAQLNRSEVLSLFGEARVFNVYWHARGYAERMDEELQDELGDAHKGIRKLDYSSVFFPSRKKRRPRSKTGSRQLATVS